MNLHGRKRVVSLLHTLWDERFRVYPACFSCFRGKILPDNLIKGMGYELY